MPKLYTIGFTKHSAREFFEKLRVAGVSALIDVRLNNVSQLSGFAKRDDLAYFTPALLGIPYITEPLLAPTADLLRKMRAGDVSRTKYAKAYLALLESRNAAKELKPQEFADACLLCSEHEAEHCHRRLAAEYLAGHWPRTFDIVHL